MRPLSCWIFVLVVGATGCQSRTPCAETATEIREIIEACGAVAPAYPTELDRECSAEQQALAECFLDCYQETSCSDLLKNRIGECLMPRCL